MLITKQSSLTGEYHTLEINVTREQLNAYYKGNMLIQNAFPNLTKGEREFIKTGATEQEWDDFFGAIKN